MHAARRDGQRDGDESGLQRSDERDDVFEAPRRQNDRPVARFSAVLQFVGEVAGPAKELSPGQRQRDAVLVSSLSMNVKAWSFGCKLARSRKMSGIVDAIIGTPSKLLLANW